MEETPRSTLSRVLREFEKSLGFKSKIKWKNFFVILFYHLLAVYWCYHYAFPAKLMTFAFAIWMYFFTGAGITCGVHRYWTHRTFKATRLTQVLLLICFTCTGQNRVYDWVRDHRLHHKYSDTEADPHDASRGFFFCHIGWFMMKKNSEVIRRGKQIDMSDITNDPLLQWHQRFFPILSPLFCFVIPTMTGIWLWDEDWKCAVAWQCFIRYLAIFHAEMTVNSLAHLYGFRPYNKNILPRENWVVRIFTVGEGWHNYHHAFPFDYKAAEACDKLNLSTKFLRLVARLGLVHDFREATPEMVEALAKRQGDGSPRTHVKEN